MTAPHLVADIGGTHCRFGLVDGRTLRPQSHRTYLNDTFDAPAAALSRYLCDISDHGLGHAPNAACIAAAGPINAGPVNNREITLTNRPSWCLSARTLAPVLPDCEIHLINDLQALGFAATRIEPQSHGPRLTVAIGTGINAAIAYQIDGQIFVPPSESGYATLPHVMVEDHDIMTQIANDFGAPLVESLLCGAGLERAYRVISPDTSPMRARDITDPTNPDLGAQKTSALFMRVLGAHLGDLALIHLPRGGISIAGSVGRAIAPALNTAEFRHAFELRGAYRDLVKQIPIHVIADDNAGLHGAAICLDQITTK